MLLLLFSNEEYSRRIYTDLKENYRSPQTLPNIAVPQCNAFWVIYIFKNIDV